LQKRDDFGFDYLLIPSLVEQYICAGRHEKTMTYTKTRTKICGIIIYFPIELAHTSNDAVNNRRWHPTVAKTGSKCLGFVFRAEGDKRKTASECIVYHRERSVGGVHHAEQINVGRHIKTLLNAPGVGQFGSPI